MATKTTQNDRLILQLKKEVEEKKEKLARAVNFRPITNMSLVIFGITYNLHVNNVNELRFLEAFLNSLNNNSLIISNNTIENWLSDITTKITMKDIAEEQKELDLMEKELESLLTNETRVSLKLDKLASKIRK